MFNPTWFYAGAVYAAAVALARRVGIDLPKRIAVFFYLLVFVFMYLPLTQDSVSLPVDFLKTLPPWEYTVAEAKALNTQTNDLALQIVPWAHQVRESWRDLKPPLWNAAAACGYPLLASAQSSALSPLRLLGLPLNLGHAMTFEAAMKILIALTFMFLWCRRRYTELASVIGAVAFGFSSFLLVWLHFPIATSACLVPAVFWVIDLLAERVTFGRVAAGAAIGAAMLFGGHPETVSHTAFVALLYALWIALVERDRLADTRKRFALALLAVVVLGALIAAPLLAPFAEAVPKSKRFAELRSAPEPAKVPFADAESARLLVQPRFYGHVPHVVPWGPAHAEAISGFAGILGIAAWVALLAHVVRHRRWRSREMFFLIAAVLATGVVLAWPGIADAFHLVFGLAANARMRLFLVFMLAALCAAAVDLLMRDRASVFIGIAAAAAMLIALLLSNFAEPAHKEAALAAMGPSFAVLACFAAAAGMKRVREAILLLLLVAVIAELWSTSRDWNPNVSSDWMYPETPLLRALGELSAKVPATEPFRIVANGPAFFPNVAAIYGYEDVRAHDPMVPARYVSLLELLTDYDPSLYFSRWTEWERPLLNFLNVRYVLTTRNGVLPPRFRMVYDGADGRIFENTEVLPRFYPVRNVILEYDRTRFSQRLHAQNGWEHTALLDRLDLEAPAQRDDFLKPRSSDAPEATVRIVEASPTSYRLRVTAPRWSLVASSVPWWPGWKVTRNGEPAQPVRINGNFLGIAVPPGELDLRISYEPGTFRYGSAVSLLTIAAMLWYGLRLRRARSRLPQPPDSLSPLALP